MLSLSILTATCTERMCYSGSVTLVINLKPDYLNRLKGTGTVVDPFRLS